MKKKKTNNNNKKQDKKTKTNENKKIINIDKKMATNLWGNFSSFQMFTAENSNL